MSKFKVWCKNKNEWEKDLCALLTSGELVLMPPKIGVLSKKTHIVCHYVGIKDYSGKDIFEGDCFEVYILLMPDNDTVYYKPWQPIKVTAEVIMTEGGPKGKWEIKEHKADKYVFSNRDGYCEIHEKSLIIGNIHENAELIKGEPNE